MSALVFQELTVVALAVEDFERTMAFYRNTLCLTPVTADSEVVCVELGRQVLMFKTAGPD